MTMSLKIRKGVVRKFRMTNQVNQKRKVVEKTRQSNATDQVSDNEMPTKRRRTGHPMEKFARSMIR